MKNFNKTKLTIDIVWANVFGILILLPIGLLFGLPYYLLWGADFGINTIKELLGSVTVGLVFAYTFGLIITMLLGVVLHELIHGVVWAKYAKRGFKSIKFGVIMKLLTPYCHCKEPLQVKHYILGALMPAIILGLLPGVAAIIIGHFNMLLFGLFFTMAASGDFLVVNLLRKEDMKSFVQDHPSEAGCYVYRKN